MRINDLLLESTHPLFESVLPSYHPTVRLGEDLARTITEAALTADQISQLFQTVQKQVDAGGGNRTTIGKGVDAGKTVAKAYTYLKQLAQDSGPVKGFDSAFDKVAAELKTATGGDAGVMRYIQSYRNFAKAHPVAQKIIYSTLVLGAGIAAYGALGPAGVALKPVIIASMKFTDKLLQGEKFSTAAIAGAEVFAAAEIMSKIGGAVKAMVGGGTPTALPKATGGAGAVAGAATDAGPGTGGGAGANAADAAGVGKLTAKAAVDQLKQKFLSGEIKDYPSYQNALRDVFSKGSISGQLSLDQHMVSSQLEKQLGITFKGQYPDAVTDAGAKLMKQAGVQDMTGQGDAKLSTGETPAQQAARYAKNDVGNTPGQQATKDALRAGNAADAVTGSSPTSKGVNVIKKMIAAGEIKTPEDFKAALKTAAQQAGYNSMQAQSGISNIQSALQAELRDAGYGSKVRIIDQDFVDALAKKATGGAATESQVMEAFRGTAFAPTLLTETQVKRLFQNLEEGPIWDKIKSAGGAVAGAAIKGANAAAGSKLGQAAIKGANVAGQKIATGAENLTNKVTADKLMGAWKKAGSPTDSTAVFEFLKTQGIDENVLRTAFKAAKIPVGKAKKPAATPGAATAGGAAGKPGTAGAATGKPGTAGTTPSGVPAISAQYNAVLAQIQKLPPAEKQKAVKYIQTRLAAA